MRRIQLKEYGNVYLDNGTKSLVSLQCPFHAWIPEYMPIPEGFCGRYIECVRYCVNNQCALFPLCREIISDINREISSSGNGRMTYILLNKTGLGIASYMKDIYTWHRNGGVLCPRPGVGSIN